MNTQLSNPQVFLKRLLSTSWELENFIITFEANDLYSGLFHIHYLSTGRRFTGNYFVMTEISSRPVEITLIALKSKFRTMLNGELKASHFVNAEGQNLPEILNAIIDIF